MPLALIRPQALRRRRYRAQRQPARREGRLRRAVILI